jgi:hypothetical protein
MNRGKVLTFGAFQGSVEISMEDNCLFGRILNIKDIVTYEAKTPQELEGEFRKAVIGYMKISSEKDLIQALDMALILADELNAQIDAMTTYLETRYPTPTATAA